ncbi:putative mitochondrial carrier protein [Aspergillus candidus]|uniref:Putative mitochondrial carrier protein n=1 Tax=Aspergillus candidus TaxID=41067 RepID=A0A2I2FPW8_ASPCN|nr:putative mitochondrial carrier protein [Aspergillus candidus]PLB42677.1 putative mitochondrial carrier protein [Aspergillus candidus]
MSLTSRVFGLFTTTENSASNSDAPAAPSTSQSQAATPAGDHAFQTAGSMSSRVQTAPAYNEEEEPRPPYLHAMLAGGTGGTCGDMLMHSLDTVKTRQQGDPTFPPKYHSMTSSYATIYRQEGLMRGLYGGVTPALWGSFPGTVIFFGMYEFTKRKMIDAGITPDLAYLSGGFFADLAASVVYVPSEVLKTRLQLQGRFNNPHFPQSGYNYRGTTDALRTIIRQEGFSALFYGYKATIFRDLPFSALQFAFYEREHRMAIDWMGSRDIGLGLEILTAATAGGMAGVITCPMDVVKTRVQTQKNPETTATGPAKPACEPASTKETPRQHQHHSTSTTSSSLRAHSRYISHSSPSTSVPPPGTPRLDTSSFFTGLKMIYQTEGVAGWFRGVGPRGVWTSIQSGTMLVLYQYLLKQLDSYQSVGETTPL